MRKPARPREISEENDQSKEDSQASSILYAHTQNICLLLVTYSVALKFTEI